MHCWARFNCTCTLATHADLRIQYIHDCDSDSSIEQGTQTYVRLLPLRIGPLARQAWKSRGCRRSSQHVSEHGQMGLAMLLASAEVLPMLEPQQQITLRQPQLAHPLQRRATLVPSTVERHTSSWRICLHLLNTSYDVTGIVIVDLRGCWIPARELHICC